MTLAGERVIDRPVTIAGGEYRITCLSMGNPHCVVFADRVDEVDVARLGPQFEHADIFPARTNTEFIRVVNRTTIKMRVWERGNGETRACGTGACAAVVAATENGLCPKGEPITVKVSGGDLIVTYDDDGVRLTGNAEGVKVGGKLALSARKLVVSALVENLPDEIVVDVTELGVGKTIFVGDLEFENLKFITPATTAVCAVRVTRASRGAAEAAK